MRNNILLLVTSFLFVFQCTTASAYTTKNLTETFQSGATFDGQLVFSDSFEMLYAVNGTLNNNPGSDPITWVYNGHVSQTTDGNYFNFLNDGTPPIIHNDWTQYFSDWTNYIAIEWKVSSAGKLILDGPLNFRYTPAVGDYNDFVTTYSFDGDPLIDLNYVFDKTPPVPEPSTIVLFGAGMFGIVLLRKRSKI